MENQKEESMETLLKKFIIQRFKYDLTRLECINLGWNKTDETKCGIELCKMAIEKCKKELKN